MFQVARTIDAYTLSVRRRRRLATRDVNIFSELELGARASLQKVSLRH